jgi:hypothetical protein
VLVSAYLDQYADPASGSRAPVEQRFIDSCFVRPYASFGRTETKTFQSSKRVDKEIALQLPYRQLNTPYMDSYIVIDVDRATNIIPDGAPTANLIVTNPANGHAHVIYELARPVWTKFDPTNGDNRPVRYLHAVRRGLTHKLSGDPNYTGMLAKNPFHDAWITQVGRSEPYTLGELACYVDLSNTAYVANGEGRNCSLFDSIRFWAYRAVRTFSDFEPFRAELQDRLTDLNYNLDDPLPQSEVRGIGRSVSRWVWRHQSTRLFDKTDPKWTESELYKARQRAGFVTTQERHARTLDDINMAVQDLYRQGVVLRDDRPSLVKLIEHSGLSQATLYRYRRQIIWQVIEPAAFGDASAYGEPVTIPVTSELPGFPIAYENPESHREDEPEKMTVQYTDLDENSDPIRMTIQTIRLAKRGITIEGAPDRLARLAKRITQRVKMAVSPSTGPLGDEYPDGAMTQPSRHSIFI